MSGRIRTVKPEMLEDEKTASLSHEAFRLFVGMILLADDHGNLRANEKQLDAAVFWSRETREGLASVLRELRECGLVTIYTVRGQSYAHLCGWSKHQKIDRPSKPRVPTPAEADSSESQDNINPRETLASDSRDPRETLDPRARAQDPDHDPDHRPPTKDQEQETPPPPSGDDKAKSKPKRKRKPKSDEPMPFTIAQLTSALDETSGGRAITAPFDPAIVGRLTRAIRTVGEKGRTVEHVRMAGRFLREGGMKHMCDGIGLTWLAAPGNLADLIGKAESWHAERESEKQSRTAPRVVEVDVVDRSEYEASLAAAVAAGQKARMEREARDAEMMKQRRLGLTAGGAK
jgi:hypothetical protein